MTSTHKPNIYFLLLITLSLCKSIAVKAKVGDKAFLNCANYARSLLECQNILHPELRKRVPIDALLYPHMALIGFRDRIKNITKWQCGGTIINEKWVLTAAHCLEDANIGPASDLKIGTATMEFVEFEDLEQNRKISELVPHPDYKPPSKYHDIALVRAEYNFVLNRDIRIACLPWNVDVGDISNATVIGFGTTTSGGAVGSETLMEVNVDIVEAATCNRSVRGLIRRGNLKYGINENLICAGDYENGGKDACQGDSGGPLQTMPSQVDCEKTFPLHTIIGIASFGNHCGFKKSPGIYTRVSSYVEWIESVVWPTTS